MEGTIVVLGVVAAAVAGAAYYRRNASHQNPNPIKTMAHPSEQEIPIGTKAESDPVYLPPEFTEAEIDAALRLLIKLDAVYKRM